MGALPHYHDYFGAIFQIGNVAFKNLEISYEMIKAELDLKVEFHGSQDDEIKPMEVTLYEEWEFFKNEGPLLFSFLILKDKALGASLKNHFIFLKDIVGILAVGFILIIVE